MRKITIFILTTLVIGQLFCQTDKNGNPVFNSVTTGVKSFDKFILTSNYYTLKNNIDNRESSVFIADNPTLNQIEDASQKLASDFFIVSKSRNMIEMILLRNEPKREFMVVLLATNEQSTFPCALKGDITENRAKELIKANYDPNAKIENNILTFNNRKFQLIADKDIEKAALALIKKEKLDKKQPSETILLAKDDLKEYILTETKEGGKFDFFTEIKGHEFDGIQIKPGLFSTKLSIALYKWGRACFESGVNTIEDTYEIFAIRKGNELNEREKDYIKMGFNKELEK